MKIKPKLLTFWPVLVLLGVIAFLFREVFFPPFPAWALSRESGDVATIYYYWRSFGFESLKAGTLPFWNPAIFCGVPFMAYPESAIFYPLNLIFLFLKLPTALNGSFIIHLAGLVIFQFFWLRSIGSARWPSLLGSLVLGFSAPVILHLNAGHLSNICTMAWVPLLFLLAEGFLRTRRLRWAAGLGLFLALQLLAGHWQYLYYTVLGLTVYILGRLMIDPETRKRWWKYVPPGVILCLVIATGLTAVQTLPALEVSRDSFRKGLDLQWASAFSLPPVNLLTFIIPGYLGDTVSSLYRGRYYFWEMCGYLGFIPLVLAGLSVLLRKDRLTTLLAVLAGGALLIALGTYTPLFKVLYSILPGFRYFRGSAKSLFMVAFFLSALAARGADCLSATGREDRAERNDGPVLRFSPSGRRTVFAVSAGLLLLVALGSLIFSGSTSDTPPKWWQPRLESELLRGPHYDIVPPGQPLWWKELMRQTPPDDDYPAYVRRLVGETPFPRNSWRTLRMGISQLGWTALAFGLILGASALLHQRRIFLSAAVTILAATELISWAKPYITGFDSRVCLWKDEVRSFFEDQALPFRYLSIDPADYNRGMLGGFASILGYQADATRRYLEYINVSQGLPPEPRELVPVVINYSRLLDLMNTRFVITPSDVALDLPWFREALSTAGSKIWKNRRAADRALVSSRARVITTPSAVLRALNRADYQPAEEVIFEESPPPRFLKKGEGGTARVVEYGSQEITIRAELDGPGILLVNESWSPGWKAYVDGEEQKIYRANYLMRAVCLEAGSHTVRFIYRPHSFIIGAVISVTALVILIISSLAARSGRFRAGRVRRKE
ncbi:MAG: YfhO family protein [Candidatus Euphemobacter frigidus]|nr:YfhO family protein [Candidatus Euphemobacter frigidus]MDP8275411.1 YfhO family protein [Candidatus Euphemobacter frigidus]